MYIYDIYDAACSASPSVQAKLFGVWFERLDEFNSRQNYQYLTQ